MAFVGLRRLETFPAGCIRRIAVPEDRASENSVRHGAVKSGTDGSDKRGVFSDRVRPKSTYRSLMGRRKVAPTTAMGRHLPSTSSGICVDRRR